MALFGCTVLIIGQPEIATADNTDKNSVFIDSVEINTENVYDLSDPRYDNIIFRLANKTHIVTRRSVIARELLIAKGDLYDTALVNEAIRNLRQLPYLLKTDIALITGQAGENILVVTSSDKWTTTGGLSIHRSSGRSDLQIGIEENNLLGYGMFMSHDFFVLEDDRNYYQGQISAYRFLGKSAAVSLFYSDSPKHAITSIALRRPFYSLRQNLGGGLIYSDNKNRLDYYLSGQIAAQDRILKSNLIAEGTYRTGPNRLKYYVTARYEFADIHGRPRKYTAMPIIIDSHELSTDSISALIPAPPVDTIYHYGQLALRLKQINYRSFRRINRFSKIEDFNIGFDGHIYAGLAISSKSKKRIFSVFGLWPEYTHNYGQTIFITGFHAKNWFDGTKWLRREYRGYSYFYMKYNRTMTLAIAVNYIKDELPDNALSLYLDEDRGLRGYSAFGYGGNERVVVNIENRLFSDIELFSVGLGGVIFADIGNIWSHNKGFRFENIKPSFGAGFRFGVSRSTQAEVIRLDFAYAVENKQWQISVGTGQYF
ncbi:MAG: hypothetical protein KAR42_09755 [candidate division Zixibacteria bacterium]|nr:hypothetical protein [candidate division Zixibacteria bacterium]